MNEILARADAVGLDKNVVAGYIAMHGIGIGQTCIEGMNRGLTKEAIHDIITKNGKQALIDAVAAKTKAQMLAPLGAWSAEQFAYKK